MLESCIRSIIHIFIVTISGIDYIRQHIEEPSLQLADANRSSSSDDDDIFSALQSSQAQLDGYLACLADQKILSSGVQAFREAEHFSTCLSGLRKALQHRRTCLQSKKSETQFSQLWKPTSSKEEQTPFQFQLITSCQLKDVQFVHIIHREVEREC